MYLTSVLKMLQHILKRGHNNLHFHINCFLTLPRKFILLGWMSQKLCSNDRESELMMYPTTINNLHIKNWGKWNLYSSLRMQLNRCYFKLTLKMQVLIELRKHVPLRAHLAVQATRALAVVLLPGGRAEVPCRVPPMLRCLFPSQNQGMVKGG